METYLNELTKMIMITVQMKVLITYIIRKRKVELKRAPYDDIVEKIKELNKEALIRRG